MKKIDNEELRKSMGLGERYIQPYDYDRYKAVNPNLTVEAYKHLRSNGSEWKILCGLSFSYPWGVEILKEVWWLNENFEDTDFYKYRYVPEVYLKLNTW